MESIVKDGCREAVLPANPYSDGYGILCRGKSWENSLLPVPLRSAVQEKSLCGTSKPL